MKDHRKVENVTDVIGGTVVFRTFDSLLVTKLKKAHALISAISISASP